LDAIRLLLPSSEKVKSGKLVPLAVGQSYLLIRSQLDLSKNTLLEKVNVNVRKQAVADWLQRTKLISVRKVPFHVLFPGSKKSGSLG